MIIMKRYWPKRRKEPKPIAKTLNSKQTFSNYNKTVTSKRYLTQLNIKVSKSNRNRN